MKALCVCLTVAVFSILPLSAEPTAPLETMGLAGELLDVMKVEKTMNDSFDQMQASQQQMLAALPAGTREKAEKAMSAALKESGLDWKAIRPVFVEIYASTFSADELKGMIEFFRTPLGQKWIDKQPEVQAKTMEKMQGVVLQAQPKILEAVQKALKE
ncbi:MAG: DUF2059 domain-containing protein [Terrimicrobiaceae bacterium]|nr:DUF2059 domain-containing protein [Terrimicrobiaceae bacterium]